ncbi:MAG: hypothetical protein QW194_00995 [Candidatus Micrarchaeaceae archaeon]
MQMPQWRENRIYMLMFMTSIVLLLFSDVSIFTYGYLSEQLMAASSALLASFFVFAIAFLAYGGAYRRIVLTASFVAMVVGMAASYAILYGIGYNFLSIAGLMLDYPFAFFLTIVLLLFISIGRYAGTFKMSRRAKMAIALSIVVIIAVLMWYFYFSGKLISSSVPDDEEFLALHAVQSLISGHNPYAMNVSALELYEYLHINGSVGMPTLTTYNRVVGFMDYPDLYFLSLAPFYMLAKPSVYSYSHIYMLYSYALFMLIFIVALVYAIEKDYTRRPNYWIIVFAAMFMLYISSVVDFLMFAMLLFAYKYIDNKYAFILLGIAASFQEELWIPVVLLVALRFNRGIAKGLWTAVGTAATFFAVNAYFILLAPGLYIRDVFAPVGNLLFPSPYGVFGYTLLYAYPMPLGAFSVLFYSAIIAGAIALAYSGRKLLVGVLSLLPLMFLYHSIPTYYFFFGTFAVVSLYIGKNSAPSLKRRAGIMAHRKRYRALAVAAIVLIVAFDSAYVYVQHEAYASANPFRAVSGSIVHAHNETYYNLSVQYDSDIGANYSIFAYTFNRGLRMIPDTYGLFNQSVLKADGSDEVNVSDYASLVNPNVARFLPDSEAHLYLELNNSTITTAVCNIYYRGFYYICPATTLHNR